MASVQQVPPIARGYAYAVQLDVSSDDEPFPEGCSLRAQICDYVGASAPIGTLTTGDGSIVVVDSHNIVLHLSPAITGALGNTSAAIDLVRDDVVPEQWLGIQITFPVVRPVTVP